MEYTQQFVFQKITILKDKKCVKKKEGNKSNSCKSCRFMLVYPNSDPDDWFRDEDIGVLCLNSQKTLVDSTEYLSREELKIPSWCELSKSEKMILSELKNFEKSLDTYFGQNDKDLISRAIELMIVLHSDQKARPDGKPYIWHTLDVANRVLNHFKVGGRDIVIAALLHDSVEDQTKRLAGLSEGIDENQLSKSELRVYAFATLQRMFGERVVLIIRGMTNPIITSKDLEEKRRLYKEHVAEAVQNSDVCVVKYADFSGNALQLHKLPGGDEKRVKLQKKYGPVLNEVFIPLLKNMDSKHPLFHMKNELVDEAEKYYNEYYKA